MPITVCSVKAYSIDINQVFLKGYRTNLFLPRFSAELKDWVPKSIKAMFISGRN